MKVKIKRWHTVGIWQWNMEDSTDVCGICHNPFDACCSYCKMPGDQCPLLWGKCTHCFHLHCISKWLETKDSEGTCPMDRQPFEAAT
ncbi:anaphase-promoting complex subunit Apc11 [Gamsiella multidivaricata]|uniref:anaphase-promoting complex subunit Apc11 n=1 Tax=Gamsiella multidivaricata TaxID=101098 RepID=UPI0022211208|nr:anaphase-promoting complex subunit Apc11 [Gamsiella multidivaricata]KAI7828816.1 anaphase-promoting complex subunit Apc11 [Gamsiella multidivaricata]